MNNLKELLSNKSLEILYLISEETLSIRDIAYKLKCSPGKVHQAVSIFKKNEIINTERYKNTLLTKPNRKNPIYKKIKSLININKIINSKAYKKLKKQGVIGVYGSYDNGTDDKESDIDMIIITEKKEIDFREELRNIAKELNKKVNPLVINKNKLKRLEESDPQFYLRLKLTTIELNGEIFG